MQLYVPQEPLRFSEKYLFIEIFLVKFALKPVILLKFHQYYLRNLLKF